MEREMDYKVVAPPDYNVDAVMHQKVLLPFDPAVLNFIESLSQVILRDSAFKDFPEMTAMAYWMRKSNISRLRGGFDKKRADKIWIGRGVVFHIAPANVDSIFIYSWFLSMLVGNINIIRISTRTNEQIDLLTAAINRLCKDRKFDNVAQRFLILRYEHSEEITGYFSSICDMRVIWGGDTTIRTIRKIPIRPKALEITFPDRFSLCMIKAEKFLEEPNKEGIVDNFYNDAYWFDQMACSSPRLVVWVGKDKDIEDSRGIFWDMLGKKVSQKGPGIATATSVDKLVAEYSVAIQDKQSRIEKSNSSAINRVLISGINDIKRDKHCGGGLFYEMKLESINQLAGLITEKEQTVAVYGFPEDDIVDFVKETTPGGIDRIVSIGNALNFSAVWDGHDLLREFCREIEINI
jgi:hypothetical protein